MAHRRSEACCDSVTRSHQRSAGTVSAGTVHRLLVIERHSNKQTHPDCDCPMASSCIVHCSTLNAMWHSTLLVLERHGFRLKKPHVRSVVRRLPLTYLKSRSKTRPQRRCWSTCRWHGQQRRQAMRRACLPTTSPTPSSTAVVWHWHTHAYHCRRAPPPLPWHPHLTRPLVPRLPPGHRLAP